MTTIGTTTNSHAADSALGTTYDYSDSNGYKIYLNEQSFTGTFTVKDALDLVTYQSLTFDAPEATENSKGYVKLASNTDMDSITVDGNENTNNKVITVQQLQYWINTVSPATTTQNGLVTLVSTSDLNRTATGDDVITIGALNTFLNTSSNAGTTDVYGPLKLATVAEASLGSDTTKAITPQCLRQVIDSTLGQSAKIVATETILGNVRLSTTSEVITANNNYDVITPSTGKAGFDSWVTDWWTVNDNTDFLVDLINAAEDQININTTDIHALQDSRSGVAPIGSIIAFDNADNIPDDWALCDGTNGTPDLRGRFIVGEDPTGSTGSNVDFQTAGTTGGSTRYSHNHSASSGATTLTWDQIPPHKHNTAWGQLIDGAYGNDKRFGSANPGPKGYNEDNQQALTASWIINPDSTDGYSYRTSANPHSHNTSISDATQTIVPPYYVVVYIQRIT